MNLARLRLILWALIAVIFVGASALYVWRQVSPGPAVPGIGGAFAMEATTGGTFTEADLVGTPSLMFFGYTFCPDVCPTTLFEATEWRSALDLTADDLNIIFVTVDPKRDTLDHMTNYLEGLGVPVIGLAGDQAATDRMVDVWGVVAEIDDDGTENYLVNHTASVFLVNAQGQFTGTISFGEARDTALAKIRRLTGTDG